MFSLNSGKTFLRKQLNIRPYLIVVEDCPPSLKFLIQFQQLQAFPYSGLTFSNSKNGQKKSFHLIERTNILQFVYIAANIALALFFWLRILNSTWHIQRVQNILNELENKNQSTVKNIVNQDYSMLMQQLKPILRSLMQIIRFIFLLDFTMALMWNLLCGGIIIRHLHSIGADHIDHNRRFAIHLIVKWFITILIMFQISILICDQYDVKILYRFFFNQTITPFERSRIVKLVISVVRHIHTFFIEISVICLFAYCQEIYSKHIRLMITKQSIDIKRLELIYIRLERLADRYETLNRYYAIPLLLNFAVDIVMMLGCSCYLIIYRPPDEINIQMISLIMAVFLFSIVRLFTCCTVATKVNNSHRMLVRHILETFDHWTIESWQSYNDIVQIGERFNVFLCYRTFHIRQAAILPIIGFAITYIVVLLQTENKLL